MTVRDLGAEYGFDDADDGWFGAAQPVDETPPPPPQPAPPRQAPAPPRSAPPPPPRPAPPEPPRQVHPPAIEDDSDPDTDRWLVEDMNLVGATEPQEAPPARAAERPEPVSVAASLNVVPTRRNGFVRAAAPSSRESRLVNSGAWDFKSTSASAPFPKRAVLISAAVLLGVAAVVGVVVLVLRGPGGESSPAAPSETSAPPAPSTSAPAVSTAAPLPPPVLAPPPPPPPPAEVAPPVVTRQYQPNYQTPDPPKKPQQNVTRAPMSATPPAPPRQKDAGRATPGQSGSHGFFG